MRNLRQRNDGGIFKNFRMQVLVCVVLLILLCILKITPDDILIKPKKAVTLILTEQTDIKEEIEKVKAFFKKDTTVASLSPVSDFSSPLKVTEIVKGFGVQDAGESDFHYGVDLKVSSSENVLSASAGEVTEIATNEEYGTYIIIEHSDEISTIYAHLNEIFVNVGATIEKGQSIAKADENLLHFEIKKGETYLNPSDFVDFGGKND